MALTDSILRYYKLDESSGTTLTDSSGNYNATNSSLFTVNSSGKIGTAYLNTASSTVNNISLNMTIPETGSISAWMNFNNTSLGRKPALQGGGASNSLMTFGNDAATPHFRFYDVGEQVANGTSSLLTGSWYHFVATWPPMKLYVNGNIEGTNSYTGNGGGSPSLYIGEVSNQTSALLGRLDEVGVWQRALSSAEVTSLYNSGNGLTYPFTTYYSLTTSVSPTGAGSVNPSTGSYLSGSSFNITASANSGYNFTNWSGDLTGSTNPSLLTMSSNKNIAANFTSGETESYVNTPIGVVNKDTMWIANGTTWVEFPYSDYFKIKKRQNQMSEFEFQLYDVSTAQKAYFKEQAKIVFFCGTGMILKGRIQTIEYKSAYEVLAKGYGMEVKLYDKQYISSGDNRIQYDNTSAKTIITEINSNILTTNSGIFLTDYGNISMRYEYANRLNALGKTVDAIDYYWWVSQTNSNNYASNYLNVASSQGSTSSVKTFNLSTNASVIEQERDTSNLVNYVYALGYGDGINQIETSVYAASTQSSFLSSNIAATNTTIPVVSASPFSTTGSVRIAEEVVSYTGKSGSDLVGCTRGVGSTAKAHNKLCYLEMNYLTSSAQTGSSINLYEIMDYTLIDKSIINGETLEVIASGYLSDRKSPIERIKIQSDEPLTDAILNIGDLVTVTSSEANINGSYNIVGQEFEDNYGVLTMNTEVSNRSLEFIEAMKKSKEESENSAKYMQGATNIYSVNEAENCDLTHYLDMRFFIPNEAIAINKILLNFKLEDFRAYESANVDESAHTHGVPALTVNGATTRTSTSGNQTPTATSGVSVWSTYTVDYVTYRSYSLCYILENLIGSPSYYTTRCEAIGANMRGASVNVNLTMILPSTNTLIEGNQAVSNNSVRYFTSGESSYSSLSGWFKAYDANFACTYGSGIVQNIYSHSHGTHSHSIPSLTVNGSTTQSSTSNAGSAHTHGITYGIYEESLTSPSVDLYTGEDGGSMTLKGTYTTNQTEINLTNEVIAIGAGKWVNVQFRPNKRMRIEANIYIQIFIKST